MKSKFKYATIIALATLLFVSTANAEPPVTDGLVVHWAGEDNTLDSWGDDPGENAPQIDGIAYNGVGFKPGIVGQAFDLSGGGQYAVRGNRTPASHIQSNNRLSLGNTYTVAMFLRPNEVANNPMWSVLFHLGDSDSCNYEPEIIVDQTKIPNEIRAQVSGCRGSGSIGEIEINPGEWIHYAQVSLGNQQRVYINGNLVLTTNKSARSITDFFLIGAYKWGPAPDGYGFEGLIDELTIYNRPLEQAEIQQLASPVLNDSPVATNDTYSTKEDMTLRVAAPGVLGNDEDVDGDSLNAKLVSNVTNGTLTLNSDGSFVYTPKANFFGSDSFTYKANDGTVDSNIATVNITVMEVPPQEETKDLAQQVDNLVKDGVLNTGQGNSLTSKLDQAIKQINAGKTKPACNMLQSFINQVTSFISSEKLSTAQGQALIDKTNNIRAELGCS